MTEEEFLKQELLYAMNKLKKHFLPETTIVKGIICKACKKELPEMTMKEHLDGRGCPCQKQSIARILSPEGTLGPKSE